MSSPRTGEPIFRSRVSGPGAGGGGVSVIVPVGKRAMAVRVDKIIGVSGFIQPQNRVDVLMTLPSPREKGDNVTKIVLENMLVLAAGQELEKRPGSEKAVPVDVITLEVTPVEAEKRTLAASQGRIQLALRNLRDAEMINPRDHRGAAARFLQRLRGRALAEGAAQARPWPDCGLA